MDGGEVIRRAGLSLSELGGRVGLSGEALADLEVGDAPYSTVERAVAACGLDLVAVLAEPEPDPHDLSLLDATLRMSVDERVQRLVSYVQFVLAGRTALQESR